MESQSLLFLQKQLAHNVRLKRRLLGMSQEQLSFESSVDRTYVSQIERGIGNPSLLVLSKIADALQVNVVDLLENTQAKDGGLLTS